MVPFLVNRRVFWTLFALLFNQLAIFGQPIELVQLPKPLVNEKDIQTIAWSNDGKFLATVDGDEVSLLWDVAARKVIGGTIQGPHQTTGVNFDRKSPTVVGYSPYAAVLSVGFGVDDKSLVVISKHRSLPMQLWDPLTSKPLTKPMPLERGIPAVAKLSPDHKGVLMVTNPEDSTTGGGGQFPVSARLISSANGKGIGPWLILLPNGERTRVHETALSGDSNVAFFAVHQSIQRWDPLNGKRILPNLDFPNKLRGELKIKVAGNVLFASDRRQENAQLWDVKTGNPLGAPIVRNGLSNCEISPQGKWLVVYDRFEMKLIDVATGKQVRKIKREVKDGSIEAAAFSPDEERLLISNSSAFIEVWSTATGNLEARSAVRLPSPAMRLIVNPAGTQLLSLRERTMTLWKMPD